jgi:RIO-like serine/threonine protein kinase
MGAVGEVDDGTGERAGLQGDSDVVVMKRDRFGRVERVRLADGSFAVRRVANARLTPSGFVARLLLARERRALAAVRGLDGLPHELPGAASAAPNRELVRSFVPGVPLSAAEALPRDWFVHLEVLVRALHARGVCHNDLHKEQNVLVRPDGRPALVDLQLASVHDTATRSFRVRAAEDLRHVDKHRRRYERRGRPRTPDERAAERAERPPRSRLAALWRAFGKPLYGLGKRVFGSRDAPEPRRASSGPWPVWAEPLGSVAPGADTARPPIAPATKFDTSA